MRHNGTNSNLCIANLKFQKYLCYDCSIIDSYILSMAGLIDTFPTNSHNGGGLHWL